MPRIAIVTDSVACIPPDLVKKYNIFVAPVQIVWDRVTYRDGIDMSVQDFYKRLRTSKTLPTTTSAIQGEYIQIFEGLRGKVDNVVVITLTGDLGGSYTSACNARDLIPGLSVEVIDSRTAMMAQGFVALEAAKVAARGASIEEVVNAAQTMLPKVHILWTLDTLEYLRRGGRVSLPQAVLASWLKVKPIISIVDGKVAFQERTRTRPKALERLLDLLAERTAGAGTLHVAVMHGDAAEDAVKLREQVIARLKPVELLASEITPVIGTHTGPGTLGFSFYCE
ncbi:MAG: DegV family protein [Chloroflexota bacterium]